MVGPSISNSSPFRVGGPLAATCKKALMLGRPEPGGTHNGCIYLGLGLGLGLGHILRLS